MHLRRSPILVWIPLAALVVALAASFVLGRGLTSPAGAATLVPVTGTLASDVYLDATNCTPASVGIGDLVPGTDPWKTAQDATGKVCAVDFGTSNHGSGTTLSMLEDPTAAAAPADAMKCVAGCAGDSLGDFEGTAEPAAGTSAFGAQLLQFGGAASAVWSAAPAVHDVQDTASPACKTTSVGTGGCVFTWGATASSSDGSGAYQAQARLVVLAN